MAIQLINDEKIIREYEYAGKKTNKKGASYKCLTITNKRVIQEVKNGRNSLARHEMPIWNAQYVDTYLAKTSKGARLLWMLLFAVLGIGAVVGGYFLALLAPLPALLYVGIGVIALGALLLLTALIFLIAYFASIRKLFYCVISGDSTPQALMKVYGDTNPDAKNTTVTITVSPNRKIAAEMVETLGTAILEAQEYAEPVVETAPAAEVAPVVETAPVVEPAPVVEAVEAPAEEAPAEEPVEAPAEETAEAPAEEPAEEAAEAEEVVVADAETEDTTTEA